MLLIVREAGNKNLIGKMGELIKSVDFNGCKNGWYTLKFADGKIAMFTGDELRIVSFTDKLKD